MSSNHGAVHGKNMLSIYLDREVYALLVRTKNRSGRAKSKEVAIRLKDHLERFPDFYNSDLPKGGSDT